jgi:hypothetical protein
MQKWEVFCDVHHFFGKEMGWVFGKNGVDGHNYGKEMGWVNLKIALIINHLKIRYKKV